MNVPRARIIRDGAPLPVRAADPSCREEARIVRRERAEAWLGAERILGEARAQAADVLERARLDARQQQQQAEQRAREQARAELAVAWAALRAREACADQHASDRIIAVARILAERLVHEQLRVAPETIVAMAREALAQFWHAEALTVRACPADSQVLGSHLQHLGVPAATLQLVADQALTPGSVHVTTSTGSLQADVAVQLDRLVEALHK